jgi:hypothetical protein
MPRVRVIEGETSRVLDLATTTEVAISRIFDLPASENDVAPFLFN